MKKVSTVAARTAVCLFYGTGEDCLMRHCGSGGSHVDGREAKLCSFVAFAEDRPLVGNNSDILVTSACLRTRVIK